MKNSNEEPSIRVFEYSLLVNISDGGTRHTPTFIPACKVRKKGSEEFPTETNKLQSRKKNLPRLSGCVMRESLTTDNINAEKN